MHKLGWEWSWLLKESVPVSIIVLLIGKTAKICLLVFCRYVTY